MSSQATAVPLRSADPPAVSVPGRRLVRGRTADAAWVRPALLAVLALAALLTLFHLTENGYSNTYYAAAVKSASESWKAMFFGSLDPGSFITVDKPPLAIWVMGMSARIFGFSSFSMLLPEALATIAAVGLLYGSVRRLFGPVAGLAAALALATTPITTAIGRVNNPDALLVLLLVASGYLLVRALESGRTRTLVWCGVIVGLAFMTKMLQGWMVVPALAATYLLAGPPALAMRVRQLALAGAAMVAASAAWPLAVSLWPGAKPWIGGSTDGSAWQLIFGYNGLARITGGSGAGGGASFGGLPGLWRMFNEQVGAQVAWLVPFAAVSLVAGLWLTRRAPRTDRTRAGLVFFGLWALVHVAVFSTQKGIFHPYYVSALAPAVAALAGAGAVLMARWARASWAGAAVLAGALVATAGVTFMLMGRTPDYASWLKVVVPVALAVALVGIVVARGPQALTRRGAVLVATAATIAVLAAPAAFGAANLGRSLNGNNVLAGPAAVSSNAGGPGGGGGRPGGGTPPSGGSGAGGFGGGDRVSSSLVSYLESHQGGAKYLVAASGSMSTAPIIISTGKAVVTIGGFNGGDATPTVAQLATLVRDGDLKYVLVSGNGGGFGGPGGGGTSSALTAWVKAHGTAVSGVSSSGGTLYRVTA